MGLKAHSSLTSVNLSFNGLGLQAGRAIASALAHHHGLVSVNLRNNKMGKGGFKAVAGRLGQLLNLEDCWLEKYVFNARPRFKHLAVNADGGKVASVFEKVDSGSGAAEGEGVPVATEAAVGKILVSDISSGKRVTVLELERPVKNVDVLAWSPDGSKIVGCVGCAVVVWDACSGVTLREMQGHAEEVCAVAWSPDNTNFVTASRDKTLIIWDAVTGARVLTLEGHSFAVAAVDWSPDGSRIVSGGQGLGTAAFPWDNPGEVFVWDAASGERLLVLRGNRRCVRAVSWSPDGMCIASASDRVVISDARTGHEISSLSVSFEQPDCGISSVAWSPDGDQLAVGVEGKIVVWEANSGRQIAEIGENIGAHITGLAMVSRHEERESGTGSSGASGNTIVSRFFGGGVVVWGCMKKASSC
mmetsp:Transcript_60875/g.162923  ORF Transcript_60875/g.162923 Transcript_60875/m.162923 type:complete len:416 (-) Transcript_60875:152-1399(-)